MRLIYARQKIRAAGATKAQAHTLSVTPGSALLFIERITFTDQRVPIEFLRTYYRGDRYTLYNELHE
ncbi:MAG: hypothetical protein B6D39_08530 [Anaerolineae bacterium UTCFX2]|jgi:GntR family transcriptional regulator|nr:MAG: hypothetical protein B6D39_08530 [Anaerolineae bacterium UTCFX2]